MGERQQQVLLGRLPVGPIERYAGSCPRFSEPKEVASFSRGADRKIAFDRSALRRFGAPRLPAALDEGFETYVAKSSGEAPAPSRLPLRQRPRGRRGTGARERRTKGARGPGKARGRGADSARAALEGEKGGAGTDRALRGGGERRKQ